MSGERRQGSPTEPHQVGLTSPANLNVQLALVGDSMHQRLKRRTVVSTDYEAPWWR